MTYIVSKVAPLEEAGTPGITMNSETWTPHMDGNCCQWLRFYPWETAIYGYKNSLNPGQLAAAQKFTCTESGET